MDTHVHGRRTIGLLLAGAVAFVLAGSALGQELRIRPSDQPPFLKTPQLIIAADAQASGPG